VRSPLLGQYSALFSLWKFSQAEKKEKRSKKERKRPVETAASVEIRKKRGLPQKLGKAFGFPTVPTGPTRIFLFESDSKKAGSDPP